MTKFIKVIFQNSPTNGYPTSKEYSYKTLLDVQVDDLVVVQVYDSYQVGKVTKVSSIPTGQATKYAIQKVDVDYGTSILKKEQLQAEITALLDAKLKARATTNKYDVLSDDPEAAELLKRLREI